MASVANGASAGSGAGAEAEITAGQGANSGAVGVAADEPAVGTLPLDHVWLPSGRSQHKVALVAAVSREVLSSRAEQGKKLDANRLRRVCQGAPWVEANDQAADDVLKLGRQQIFAMLFQVSVDQQSRKRKRQTQRKRGFYIGRAQQLVKYYGRRRALWQNPVALEINRAALNSVFVKASWFTEVGTDRTRSVVQCDFNAEVDHGEYCILHVLRPLSDLKWNAETNKYELPLAKKLELLQQATDSRPLSSTVRTGDPAPEVTAVSGMEATRVAGGTSRSGRQTTRAARMA